MMPVDFGGLISKVCAKLDGAARAKSIRLECSCDEGKVTLSGDSESLEQMIYNLVENAIFYSHDYGRVTVRAGTAGGRIRLVVEDQGIGIPPSDISRIFDRFYRADPSRSDSQGHVGLGLALVKLIVQMHGGTIDVDSLPGKGSRFTVSFPASAG